jgi:hypothetical protein
VNTLTTALYDMDSRNDSTFTQAGNSGALTLLGPFGATINDALVGIGFDIYTTPGNLDPSISGDFGFAVLKRGEATANGAYLLYQVSLATGGISNGKLVGPLGSPSDFTGGFAVEPGVPEPATFGMMILGCAALCTLARRRA